MNKHADIDPHHSQVVHCGEKEWIPFALPGTFFKPLHLDDNAGRSTFLLKVPAGCPAPMHKHLAAVEAYVIQGKFGYEGEGIVAAGDYIFEPGGCVHEPIAGDDEDLILFVVAHGGIVGVNEDGSFGGVVDNDVHYECAAAGGDADHLR
ncbi:MAG: 2,4'-dihydroxyacetophenone dioxygenase family protein [Pseudomonadota bacterium]